MRKPPPADARQPAERAAAGREAEDLAVLELERRGYEIVTRNFRVRQGEIDVIARHQDLLCFVEVRARRSARFGAPAATVSATKRARLAMAAARYLEQLPQPPPRCRFDVVSVLGPPGAQRVELLQHAFEVEG